MAYPPSNGDTSLSPAQFPDKVVLAPIPQPDTTGESVTFSAIHDGWQHTEPDYSTGHAGNVQPADWTARKPPKPKPRNFTQDYLDANTPWILDLKDQQNIPRQ